MSYKGEIKFAALISNNDGEIFRKQIAEHVEIGCKNLYAEIQYQPLINLNGIVCWTAFVVGRVREDSI